MKHSHNYFLAALATLAFSAANAEDSLTIYSSAQPGSVPAYLYRPVANQSINYGQIPGFAMVRHQRDHELDRGANRLRVSDVAALIDPTTVTFRSLTEPATRVLEQNFEFDLVSRQQLIQRYLGETIEVEQQRGDAVKVTRGTLLSADGGLILQTDDGQVQTLAGYSNIRFPELPGGLITEPTLVWNLQSPTTGVQTTVISYETAGMTWWADYNVTYRDNEAACEMDLGAWVSIINRSGAGYGEAKLKLVAGDVNRAPQSQRQRMDMQARRVMAEAMEDSAGFQEKGFFEYHLYTLGRATDLPDNSTKQIELFPPVQNIRCQKELVYAPTRRFGYSGYHQVDQGYGRNLDDDVSVYLRFNNEQDEGLGMPLPAGRIRVNQLDTADGAMEFIGEDVLDHTPRNEDVLIRTGNAFDVIGERTQVDYRIDTASKQLWETVEVEIRNRKETPVEVIVQENLYRTANWTIEKASLDHEKVNANQIRFRLPVGADAEKTVLFTVHYTW